MISEIAWLLLQNERVNVYRVNLLFAKAASSPWSMTHLFLNRKLANREISKAPTRFIATNQTLQTIQALEFKTNVWCT